MAVFFFLRFDFFELIKEAVIVDRSIIYIYIYIKRTANEAFEKVASYGLVPNMILYLMNDYKVGIAKGQNILFLSGAATNFTPLLGAFLADSYLGRFLTIGFGSIFSFLVSSSSSSSFSPAPT